MPRGPGKGGSPARSLSRQISGSSPGTGGDRAQTFRGPPSASPRPSGAKFSLVRTVTGAIAGTASRIRLTVTAHGFDTGQQITVAGVGGVPAATGQWTVVVVTANTIELAGSTFAGTFTSGGTASRY